MALTFYSSNNSVLINKKSDCIYDVKINPASIPTGTGGGPSVISTSGTVTTTFSGNGITVPLSVDVKVATDVGNILTVGTNGLYVPSTSSYTNTNARAAISISGTPLTYNS